MPLAVYVKLTSACRSDLPGPPLGALLHVRQHVV